VWRIVENRKFDGGTLDLRRNGIGYASRREIPADPTPFPWHVRKGRLAFGPPKSGSYDWLTDGYIFIRNRFYGDQNFATWDENSYTILTVSRSRIEAIDDKDGAPITLIRRAAE
jgi:hypothetical protein